MELRVDWRVLVLAAIVGACIGLTSGFVFEQPRLGIPENKYYGFPLVWRITNMNTGETHALLELLVDCVFWIAIVLIMALLMKMLMRG